MLFPARPRPRVTRLNGPMAVPIGVTERQPLGTRLATGVHGLLAHAHTEAVRRIVLWLLVTLCFGTLGLAYLLQTSHVAALANRRAQLERQTTELRDANARLAARAAGYQTLSRADATARDQGLRPALAGSVGYVTLPDVPDAAPTVGAAPTKAPGIVRRVVDAIAGRAGADHISAAATPVATPGAKS